MALAQVAAYREISWEAHVKAAIYARVSTNEQSPQMQLRDLRAYCAARRMKCFGEYVDVAVSGATDRRPGLDKLMNDARKRRFDVVLVWRFDRFARNTKHLVFALEEFRLLGIQFVSYQENIDTSSPMGQAVFTIISAVAQLERDLIRERIQAGIRNARKNGKEFGRPRKLVDKGKIQSLRKQGVSLRKISQLLHLSYGTVQRAA
jgi:DNA invertase Pin-like site-specific DNA recombinase